MELPPTEAPATLDVIIMDPPGKLEQHRSRRQQNYLLD
jgi:hypothetical protein